MLTNLEVNRPLPILSEKTASSFKFRTDIRFNIESLEAGYPVLISDFYHNGLKLLKEIKLYLHEKFPNKSFKEQRMFRAEYHKLSNYVLIQIINHKLVAKKSPLIGWLEKLYPENGDFMLSFPQIQGLNSSWQWYKNGISIPVLRNKIHPYYGTYFPTRFDHLILFNNWLKRYKGPKKSAIDIGFGSGVLSLQMVEHGFQKVFGTDINPNAIIGLREFMGTSKISRKIELEYGHLFGKCEKPAELIVFNPPWLPQSHELDRIDEAIYYNKSLFPEFFSEAKQRLLPDGILVLIFSNLAQITNLTNEHPIEKELAEGGRFKLEKCFKKNVKTDSKNTKRDAHWRAAEEVELWVLKNK